jgi:AraC family transcriptional regulator
MDCRASEPAWTAHRLLSSLRSGTLDTLALESLIARLIEALCPAPPPKMSARMARVASELRERFAQPWSLRELAREAQVHPVHFARAFRHAYGESVGEYVHRLRVEHAARELARTSAPLAEIAHDAGFADQAHLTRVFRRRTGATPARFRRTFQQRKMFQSFNTS